MATATNALVLFPGALGDFMCFLPTLAALRGRGAGRLCLVAQPAFLPLVQMPDLEAVSMHRHVVADLFASGSPPLAETTRVLGGFDTVHSWTGFGNPEVRSRLSEINAGLVSVHQFRGMLKAEHAVDYYARCVGVSPVQAVGTFVADDPGWMRAWLDDNGRAPRRLTVIHPGSGSARKNWVGFDEVCRSWRAGDDDRLVILSGPVESEARPQPEEVVGENRNLLHVQGRSLSEVAALLRRSALYIGNDSGISHLASAVGARGLVLFGPTDPRTWAPRGGLQVIHAPIPCARCGPDVFCTHRLPIDRVIQAMP